MRNFYLIVFLFFNILSYSQTGKITGSLYFEDGTPASYAIVYIQKLSKYSATNDNGLFEFTDIPYGKHVLEVRSLEAEEKKITVNLNKEHTKVSLTLRENPDLNLAEVVVWGKSEMKKLKDQGFAVGLIETKKAEFQSLQTSELLDRTAGVRIRQTGGMGSDIQYNINGLTGSSVRIFIDGIPIRNFGSSFSLSSIPPAMIERIEVYKGVVPAHLAEDALGGAINIILKKLARNNLATSYSFGSFNTHRWDMNANYRHEKTGFTASGSAFYNYTDNSYKVWGDQIYITDPATGEVTYVTARRFHDSYQSYGVNADMGFTDVKWADQFLIGILFSSMDKDIQHGSTMAVVYGNRTSGQNTQMVNMKYQKKDILKGLDANAFVSYSRGVRNVVDTTNYKFNWNGEIPRKPNGDYYTWIGSKTAEAGQATLAENTERMIAGRANIAYRFSADHKLMGHYLLTHFTRDIDDPMMAEAERELTDTRYLTKKILGVTYENKFFKDKLKSSFFFKHYIQHVKLIDPKTVDGEIVPDKYERTIDANGFGAAISYEVFPRILVLLSGEKALRLPEGTELLGNTTENVSAAYDLKPESSYNINLGFNVGPFVWKRHRASVDVNFFYRDIRDMITRAISSSTLADNYSYENLGKVLSKGVDVEFRYDYNDRIILTSNLSSFNARFNLQYDEHGTQYSYYKDRLRNAPYLTSNNNLEYIHNNFIQRGSRLSLNYNFGYVHEFFRNWESLGGAGKAVIPAQLVHDLGVSYTFPGNKIILSFDARNFTNEQIFDNWALQKAGRAFYGKISYRIF